MRAALALLALVLAPSPQDEARGLLLLTHEADGFAPAASLPAKGTTTVPIPLQTRSERRPRAVRGPRGLGLRITAAHPGAPSEVDAVTVEAVRHPTGWEVLEDGDRLVLVGPPLLAPGTPAELARHDGFSATAAGVLGRPAEFADGLVLVATPAEVTADPSRPTGPWSPYRCHVLPAGSDAERALAPIDADHLFWARVRDLSGCVTADLELRFCGLRPPVVHTTYLRHGFGREWSVPAYGRLPAIRGRAVGHEELFVSDGKGLAPPPGGALELWFSSPPAAPEGETWTLLVTVHGGGLGLPPEPADPPEPAEPTAAAAPRAPLFEDVARERGAGLVHLEGPDEQLDIRPTMGPGVAWGDADGDGRTDLYLVQGAGRDAVVHANRLLLLQPDHRFRHAAAAGVEDTGAGMGALFLDAEGDGDLDLYVANHGADALFRNRGAARFDDVSAMAGVGGDLWSAGIAAADVDRDGDLDLYVTSYLDYDDASMAPEDELERFRREDPVAMLPFAFPAQRNTFLRNDSTPEELRFADITGELGLLDEEGRGMQPVFLDFDRDGWPDLYVANDVSYNTLWRNTGGSFEDVSFSTGMDDPRGGMGVALGDVDLDGDEDLFLANWQLDANALYRNELLTHASQRHRVATFRDVVVGAGLGQPSVGVTSWGCVLADLDLDGAPDLFVANGYTSPDYESTGICVGQPDHLFLGDGEGHFDQAANIAGPDVRVALPSRSVAACDFDRDGDLDLVVTANNSAVRLLENRATTLHPDRHWVGLQLDAAGGNTHAIGAEVTVRAGGVDRVRVLRAGSSYLAGEPAELHFGLGEADTISEVEVRWPSGRVSTHDAISPDGWHTITEEP